MEVDEVLRSILYQISPDSKDVVRKYLFGKQPITLDHGFFDHFGRPNATRGRRIIKYDISARDHVVFDRFISVLDGTAYVAVYMRQSERPVALYDLPRGLLEKALDKIHVAYF